MMATTKVTFETHSLANAIKTYGKFTYTLPKAAFEANNKLAQFIQKSAKLRAPKGGATTPAQLASSIHTRYEQGKRRISIVADAPYSTYQENGYESHSVSPYLHLELLEWYLKKSGGKYPPKYITVSKSKPFMAPAFWAGMKKWESITGREVKMAIIQAGFRVS